MPDEKYGNLSDAEAEEMWRGLEQRMAENTLQKMQTPSVDFRYAISDELKKARKKFPHNTRLTFALMEEVGELVKAELQGRHPAEIRKEALQVACVAIRIFEEGDKDFENLTEAEKKP